MVVFTVHEPPNPPADRIDRAAALLFLKDGFSWAAALIGPVWLILHRNWLGLALYAAAAAAIVGAFWALGASPAVAVLAILALNIYLGFESSEIERDSLEAKGWASLGTVTGKSLADCERRFFEGWLPGQPVLARHVSDAPAAHAGPLPSATPPAPVPPAGAAVVRQPTQASFFARLMQGRAPRRA